MNKKLLNKIDLFKVSIGVSFLIVAVSVAYFLLAILPSQQQTLVESALYSQPLSDKPSTTPSPTTTPTKASAQTSTLSLLEQCLDSARTERGRVNGELLKLFEQGQEINKSAFDSVEEQYQQDRQDCFAKYPQ